MLQDSLQTLEIILKCCKVVSLFREIRLGCSHPKHPFIAVENTGMNETEIDEYSRKKGLYIEQIEALKKTCMNANGGKEKEAVPSEQGI